MDLRRDGAGMRKAVAISVLVHALAAAWAVVVYWLWPPPPRLAEPPPSVPIEVVEVTRPAPVANALALYEPAEVALAEPTPHAIAAATTRHVETSPPANTLPPAGVAPTSSMLSMRTPGSVQPRVDLRLPALRDDLDAPPAGSDPAREVPSSGRLAPHGGGSYRSNEGVFTANVAPDGSVKIKNSRNLNVHLALPGRKTIGRGITDWYESNNGQFGAGKQTLADKVAGSVDKGDRSKTAVVPVAGGGFDVGDMLMRKKGQDPYAARKLAYLDATRDERVEIGTKHRAEQLAQAAKLMKKNLDRMWTQITDTAARKQALFELWDECAETGDAQVIEAGRQARKLVVGFIRAHLPAGSATAYTAAELAAFARRKHSHEEFAPYTE
jgi:hypothetical protein